MFGLTHHTIRIGISIAAPLDALRRGFWRCVLSLLLVPWAAGVAAEPPSGKPLFELGLGVGGLQQPYYPGTNDMRNVFFPAPLPIYRGRIFKSDSRGMRAEVVEKPRYRMEISADINFAIDSDDISLRRGMEDIDTMFQIGPSFEYDLYQGQRNQVKLKMPVRLNMGIGQRWSDDGMTFSPAVSFHHRFQWGELPWLASVQAGVILGTEQFHDVYYTVAERYATRQRPAYAAEGGYSGARLTASLRSRTEKRLLVLFARLDNLDGAEFVDSPLVETRNGFTVGFIYSRMVFRSQRLAQSH